jgi:hypothetical protein
MKKCAMTAIERAASAAAIVPGPIFVVFVMVKRVATDLDFPSLAGEIKFLREGSLEGNFHCDLITIRDILSAIPPLTWGLGPWVRAGGSIIRSTRDPASPCAGITIRGSVG